MRRFTVLHAVTLLVSALSVASFGGHNWFCDLFSHFRPVFFILLLSLTLILLFVRAWKMSILSVCLALANFLPLLDMYGPREPSPPSSVRILQMNVQGDDNADYRAALSLIDELKPDIVGFSEITGGWPDWLKTNLKEYKYRTIEPRFGGVALLSKLPMEGGEVKYTGKFKRPRICTRFQCGDTEVSVDFVHTVTPFHSFEIRNEELAAIADEASKCTSFVLFGDLNCTPWSYYFKKLERDGGLKDSMPGFGIQCSWPTVLPVLAIDHCLISTDMVTIDRRLCRSIGSDHFPVYVELGFRRQ